jgi:rhomboid protease GluP
MLPSDSITLVSVETLLSDTEPMNNRARQPNVCRGCGAIIGAGQTSCAVCGAPLTTAQTGAPRLGYDQEALRFARAVLGRPYLFTIVFLVANFFIFLLMWHSSGMSFSSLWVFPDEVLRAYGAKQNALINQQHQWWRFVTPMFVHVGLPHLLVNMYSLWMVGPYVEKLYGSAKFVVFWVLTGIAGVVASYLTLVRPGTPWSALSFMFKTEDRLSAGASGALFGMVGVLFVFGIKFRSELPEGFKRAFGTGLLPVILINLFIGYLGQRLIDNAAHLGGLVSGAALALVVGYRRPGERASIAMTWNVLQAVALVLVAISFFEVSKHFRDLSMFPQATQTRQVGPMDNPSDLRFKKAVNDAQDAFVSAVNGDESGVDAAIATLEAAPAPDIKADQLKRNLQSLLQRTKQQQKTAPPPDAKRSQEQQNKLLWDFKTWEMEYNDWLKTIGTQPEESR